MSSSIIEKRAPEPAAEHPHSALLSFLDCAKWSSVHTRIVLALSVAWILDGFETAVTGPILNSVSHDLHFSIAFSAWMNPIYTIGMLIGALFFGPMGDALGRRRLFLVTLGLYACATVLTGFSWDVWSFGFFRLLTGIGIGGEYAAINSAVDEFVPARFRGRTDGLINSSWNIGAIVASVGALAALSALPSTGWRLVFWFGAILAVAVLFVRRAVPESPRWLLDQGRFSDAGRVVAQVAYLPATMHAEMAQMQATQTELPRRENGLSRIWELMQTVPQRMVFSCIVNLAQVVPYYGLIAIAGIALFPALGLHGAQIPELYLLGAITGFAGQAGSAFLFDSWGRRPTMLLAFAGAAVLAVALVGAVTHGNVTAFVWIFAVFSSFSAATGSVHMSSSARSFPHICARPVSASRLRSVASARSSHPSSSMRSFGSPELHRSLWRWHPSSGLARQRWYGGGSMG